MRCIIVLTDQAMEMILTGSTATATEMERLGVVNRVMSLEQNVLNEALQVAQTIASFSAPAVGLAKEAVTAGKLAPGLVYPERIELTQAAETSTLKAGLEIERALYYSSFSLADCREGVAAFLETRSPNFEHR